LLISTPDGKQLHERFLEKDSDGYAIREMVGNGVLVHEFKFPFSDYLNETGAYLMALACFEERQGGEKIVLKGRGQNLVPAAGWARDIDLD